ncbi:MAG: efflux RND transporter periplasmic adaptor subunit [Pseudomonadales bacterium]|nr:efflux RND transporter periplasmic adaptor subunit [Pseudomonadales bacterium]
MIQGRKGLTAALSIIAVITVAVVAMGTSQVKEAGTGDRNKPGAQATAITTVTAGVENILVWETSVGQLEAQTAPMVAAEVGGRVMAIFTEEGQKVAQGQILASLDDIDFRLAVEGAEADVGRFEALKTAAKLRVTRLQGLVLKQSGSQASLDNAVAESDAIGAEIVAAQVRLKQARRSLEKARIVSPVNGWIDSRHISIGDYVKIGMPLFHITARQKLRVRLPYPENLSAVLHTGLPVKLVSPVAPTLQVEGAISAIRPLITMENRAIDVIVDLSNPGPWEPGASVTGWVQVAARNNAVVVPEVSVVRRPAGVVVYVLDQTHAVQRVIKTGRRIDGQVEVIEGLSSGEVIAADGAGFLTDGALVEIKTL